MHLKEKVNTDTVFVDVRTKEEFAGGHLESAINIPLADMAKRKQEIKELGNIPVVFYCRSGNRSGAAVAYLQKEGYAEVYNGGSLEDVRKLIQKINH